MSRKKILHIVEAMGGGVFTYIVGLSNLLVNDFDIYVAYGLRNQTPENYSDYFDSRINLIKVDNFTREINPVYDFKAYLEIRNLEKKINPDLIHLHSSKAGVLGRLAFNYNKAPVLYTPHGYSFLMEDQSKIKRFIYKNMEKITALSNCTTVSCSYGEHIESLKLTKKSKYVNNGIDTSKLKKFVTSRVKSRDKYTVFTLGRICYQKNPSLFNEIAFSCPDIDFLWIGDGELKHELTAPNIKVTGWVDRDIALKYTLNTDAFILTSLWEGLPISLLEAMYTRKVCIVSNVIGNRDVIKNGVNGFVCNNSEDFKKAIYRSKENNMAELVDTAYQDIINTYNTEVMAKSYAEIYLSLI